MARLHRAGLIAYRRSGGRNPVLRVTDEGTRRQPDFHHPMRHWARKWNGI